MLKEMKERWLKALRSGEYAQTRHVLHKVTASPERGLSEGYCCLGVLCDLVAKDGEGEWVGADDDGDDWFKYYADEGKVATNPPYTLLKQLDIPDSAGEALISMNDSEKKSFAEIADYIEEHL
jgi:hypothetical protein